jgi:hypothetical protein
MVGELLNGAVPPSSWERARLGTPYPDPGDAG